MTVGSGSRTLGGHGREMCLRRKENSNHVVKVFRSGLLEKRKKVGFSPGLVAGMESDVAGLSVNAGVNEKRAVIVAGLFAIADENERRTAFMAGHSVIAGLDERRAFAFSTPKISRRETVKSHQLAHIPYVPRSQDCDAGRDHEGPCFCQDGCGEFMVTPVVPLDDISLGLSDEASEKDTTSMLALCDGSTTLSRDLMIQRKGLEPHAVKNVCVSFA